MMMSLIDDLLFGGEELIDLNLRVELFRDQKPESTGKLRNGNIKKNVPVLFLNRNEYISNRN